MLPDLFCHLFVEIADLGFIPSRMIAALGGKGVKHRNFNLSAVQLLLENKSRIAVPVPGSRVGNHLGLPNDSESLDCNQFRIAGTDSDAEQSTCALRLNYSSPRPRALIAGAAMALPPRRPTTVM